MEGKDNHQAILVLTQFESQLTQLTLDYTETKFKITWFLNYMINRINRDESEYIHTFDDQSLYWATFDLGLAAGLLSKGFKLVDLDRANPHKVQLIFLRKGEGEIEKLAQDYWNNNFQVDALSYFNNVKKIKNQLYSSV